MIKTPHGLDRDIFGKATQNDIHTVYLWAVDSVDPAVLWFVTCPPNIPVETFFKDIVTIVADRENETHFPCARN